MHCLQQKRSLSELKDTHTQDLWRKTTTMIMAMTLSKVLRALILILAGSTLTKLGSPLLCFIGASIIASSSSSSSSEDLCTTPGCIEAGRRLATSLNTSVDPCSDFYAYTCGGWIASHPISIEKSAESMNSLASDQMRMALKTVFEEEASTSGSSSSFSSQQAKSVRLVLDLYRECMNMATRDRRGLKPLQKLLNDILGSNWPAVDESTLVKSRLDFHKGLLRTMAQAESILPSDHLPFIQLYIDKDLKSTLTRVIEFMKPKFGLTARAFTNLGKYNSEVDVYKGRIRKLAKLLFFSSTSSSRIFSNSSTVESMLESRSEEVFTLEQSLAKATLAVSHKSDIPMTLKEVTEQTSTGEDNMTRLNFTSYLNELATLYNLSYRFNHSHTVTVGKFAYYEELVKILSSTPPLVLHNYIGYKVAWYWKDATDNRARYLRLWHRNRVWGMSRLRPLWKDCLDAVINGGGAWAVSRLYVDRFVAPETKRLASEMVDDLQKVYSEMILNRNHTAWLDEPTRKKAFEKVTRMRFIVSHPDFLLNNTALDQIKFDFTSQETNALVVRGQYFESAVKMMRQHTALPLRDLHRTPDVVRDFPTFVPVSVGAKASQDYNTVAISAAQFQPPYFDPTVTAVINYGAVGNVIGHEISHHFDEAGAEHDADGNLVNWWSAETSARFNEKIKCYVKQYGSIHDRVTGDRLRGEASLGENISDNVGLLAATLAMEAMVKRGDKVQRLPQMEHFTPQQLFFLSFAQMNCAHYRLKLRKVILDQWSHLPNEYRINVPLRNLKQFSDAFSCPRGSPMNPDFKCRLFGDGS